MKVTFRKEPNYLKVQLPTFPSYLALNFSTVIEIPYELIARVRICPPEAQTLLRGMKVGYAGFYDASATYYHFDGRGPEFHLYSSPGRTISFEIDRRRNPEIKFAYDKVIVEIEPEINENAKILVGVIREWTANAGLTDPNSDSVLQETVLINAEGLEVFLDRQMAQHEIPENLFSGAA
ncbi:hypothetical protein HK096_007561 [Nowakowskiella sp. JEL0078]|nr:hypothetical protein HK096_007561 [Nowakowskiella sp. JEL0078]